MRGFPTYSCGMNADLKALEDKLAQLIGLCQQLRSDNFDLRQELAQAQDAARQMRERLTLAGDRLEALIDSLPEDAS